MPSQKTDARPGPDSPGNRPDSVPNPLSVRPPELTTRDVLSRMAREYLKPHWRLAVTALLASVVVAGATGVLPLLIKHALDNIVGSDSWMLMLVAAGAIGATAVQAIATYISKVNMNTIGQHIVATIQQSMFARIVHADLAWVSGTHSGRFLSSFLYDATRVRDSITTSIIDLGQNFLTVLALIGAMFYLNWQLALMGTTVIPVIAVLVRQLGRRTRKAAKQGMEGSGNLTAVISEALSGIRVVKAYDQEETEIARTTRRIMEVRHHALRAMKSRAMASPVTGTLSGIGIAAVIYFGGRSVQTGLLTIGDLGGFLSAMMLAYEPLKKLANTQTLMQEGVAAAIRIFPILDIRPTIASPEGAKKLEVANSAIRFDNVHFHYGDGTPALNGIDIEVPMGHTVALVGPSGSGKSTILNLVPRFYDPTTGRVTIGGQDVREVTLGSLRAASSLVTQEPFLFDDTIKANIAYGSPDATDAEIEEAARNAAAHEFIAGLPRGYETTVGEAGFKLSGGQRQRIAIARAMLKNASILLLDEATSALDTASEMQVQSALARLMQGRTTLVIAHRLSTIKHAHNIYVIDDGRVVEQGSHEELVAQGGLYAELSRSQFIEEPVAGRAASDELPQAVAGE
ncbi:ABC transporter related [Parvibaculum lavamentivorans DS-1]|uniref:ABC transporter related n=1 Tax=Parvibaculum lavamentivorans (strain DS-1 / DSM 13023 / NCIMB 13966) TaxID=402881 RepID=A7HQR7_PARL1|nr:ABC transporter ATP-binding protein [Parvibaculum lavamentivorans]ABS62250.1 ABC transporter related [Parvibaculum lavamentivorans DS-1]